jgi:hypothetical protein
MNYISAILALAFAAQASSNDYRKEREKTAREVNDIVQHYNAKLAEGKVTPQQHRDAVAAADQVREFNRCVIS